MLPETMLFMSINVPKFEMPPPLTALLPCSTVRPEIETVALESIRKAEEAPPPLMARLGAPGPTMLTELAISRLPLVSVIVPLTLKLIVSVPVPAAQVLFESEVLLLAL